MKPLAGPVTFQVWQPPLAHQGGWDEILMVLGPLAVVGLLLWLANKRLQTQLDAAQLEEGETNPVEPPEG